MLEVEGPKQGRPEKGPTMGPLKLTDLGVSKNQSSRWQAVDFLFPLRDGKGNAGGDARRASGDKKNRGIKEECVCHESCRSK